jgi:hypothetical protein
VCKYTNVLLISRFLTKFPKFIQRKVDDRSSLAIFAVGKTIFGNDNFKSKRHIPASGFEEKID